MSSYSQSYQASEGPGAGNGGCGRLNWQPFEVVAMVLGFVVFWPVGLAILLAKIWQRKYGHEGDLASFLRERWAAKRHRQWHAQWHAMHGHEGFSHGSGGFGRGFGSGRGFNHSSGHHSSGNAAFDDWRAVELKRLDEEYQKLVAAEREFADFMANLRRAKDKEEFDRFMSARRSWEQTQQSPQQQTPPASDTPSA